MIQTPIYEGTTVTTGVDSFANPVNGVPPSQWPPVDPGGVTLTVTYNGVATTYTFGVDAIVQKASTGVYFAELDTTGKPGPWQVKWEGTGACGAVWRGGFMVQP